MIVLGEWERVSRLVQRIRVPGGWIYQVASGAAPDAESGVYWQSPVFVAAREASRFARWLLRARWGARALVCAMRSVEPWAGES